MNLLPFRRKEPETRNYTDAITQAIVAASADNAAEGYVAALEIAAGQLSRAFAASTVDGPDASMFPPETMALIGRSLVEAGEAVWYRIGRRLDRVDNYSYPEDGGGMYDLTIRGVTRRARPSSVVHPRWNADTEGRGIAPLSTARALRDLMLRMEAGLRDEAGAAVGYLLPVPVDGAARNVEQLKQDLANLKGKVAVIETARGGWGDSSQGVARDYLLSRMGPNVPDGNVRLFASALNATLAACGYPIQLATDSDGTAQREAWRRYLHGTVSPLGRIVTGAAARAGLRITLDWDQLFASDISGRARAFQSLVNGGMDVTSAAAASGLLDPTD